MIFEAPVDKKKKLLDVTADSVVVAGLELPKNQERKERVPDAYRFKDFAVDEFSMKLLSIIAKSVKLDQPLLIQGEAATGKSASIEYLANLMNKEVFRMSLNGQTDVSDLIGKWVPRSETLSKRLEKLIQNPDLCDSKKATVILNRGKLGSVDVENEEGHIGLSREDLERVAQLEGIDVPEGDWVWQDGDLPRQMESGAWSVLDEVNTTEPQILVRLNAVLEKGGQLVLHEDGSRKVKRHPDFRIFATVNPPGGRYKGRVSLSAEWISRWNFQDIGRLPKEIRARRLMVSEGIRPKELADEAVDFISPKSLKEGATLVDYYGKEWVIDLFEKYSDFADKVQRSLEAGDIGGGLQKFDFDQRDDLRFREYIRIMNEPGNMKNVISQAIEFYFFGKFENAGDRMKVKTISQLIDVSEPKIIEPEVLQKKLEQELRKAKLDIMDGVPEDLRGLVLDV